jgi:hypothetical protein
MATAPPRYSLCLIEGFRNWGIKGLKDKINKLKEIEFLQFLNS